MPIFLISIIEVIFSSASASGQTVYGINEHHLNEQDISLIHSLGNPGTVALRIPFYWHDIEPQKGNWQFQYYDGLVSRAEENNIPLLGILAYSSPWASSASDSFDLVEIAPFGVVWHNNAGLVPWGTDSQEGSAKYLLDAMLEDNNVYQKVLYTRPKEVQNGFMHGAFGLTVPNTNSVQIKAKVGLLKGASSSNGVRFVISCRDPANPSNFPVLGYVDAKYDGKLDNLTADISQFKGQSLELFFGADSDEDYQQDWAVWTEARIFINSAPASIQEIFGGDAEHYPPKNPDDFANFTKKIVARYPGVEYWEIWNEENWGFWLPFPDAVQYTNLLKKTYQAAKEGSPNSKIVLGGISGSPWGADNQHTNYLKSVYANGGKYYFDILGVHPYSTGSPDSYLEADLLNLQKLMQDYGDGSKKIWVTEISWYTGQYPGSVSEATQAEYVARLYNITGNLTFVGGVFWYELLDGSNLTNREENFGLFRYDFTSKPAVYAYRYATDTTPPSITFISPTQPANGTPVTTNYIFVNISISETPGTCLLNWGYSGTWTNYTMTKSGLYCYLNRTSLANGIYQFRVYANDTLGNLNISSGTRQNTVAYSAPDTTPPGRSGGSPAGTLPAGTASATISLITDEASTCKYSTAAGVAYSLMVNTFYTTGGTSHSTQVLGLQNGTSYSYYIRCIDQAGNPNNNDYTVQFSVALGCIHKSEIPPCNNCVEDLELFAFIDGWKVSNVNVTLKELIEAIGLWKRGCP